MLKSLGKYSKTITGIAWSKPGNITTVNNSLMQIANKWINSFVTAFHLMIFVTSFSWCDAGGILPTVAYYAIIRSRRLYNNNNKFSMSPSSTFLESSLHTSGFPVKSLLNAAAHCGALCIRRSDAVSKPNVSTDSNLFHMEMARAENTTTRGGGLQKNE